MRTKKMLVPGLAAQTRFTDRHEMRRGHPVRRFHLYNPLTHLVLPPAPLPIDWGLGNTISFPVDDNDTLGCCFVAGMEHQDNAWTGCNGKQSTFDDIQTRAWYLKLSGGDNGLSNGEAIAGWKDGLPGIRAATILDALDIDPTNTPLMQSGIFLYGGVQFQFAVPDRWVNDFAQGVLWDVGQDVYADENNGHDVYLSGVGTNGNYTVRTWGSWCLMTPKGVLACDPSAFISFSLRWFNPAGYAPNGLHIATLAPLWVQAGGSSVVLQAVKQFPPPGPGPVPTPGPAPAPAPTPVPMPPAAVTLVQAVAWAVGGIADLPANHQGFVRRMDAEHAARSGLITHWPA